MLRCKKCGSTNVNVQLVNESKRRGLLYLLFKIVLFCISVLIWLLSFLLPIKRKTNKYAVCQNCGYSWRVR